MAKKLYTFAGEWQCVGVTQCPYLSLALTPWQITRAEDGDTAFLQGAWSQLGENQAKRNNRTSHCLLLQACKAHMTVYVYREEMEVFPSVYVLSILLSPTPLPVCPLICSSLSQQSKSISSAHHYLHHLLLAVVFSPLLDEVLKVNDKTRSYFLPKS